MKTPDPFASIASLASNLQRNGDQDIWQEFEVATAAAFGHRLFTVLAFDAKRNLLLRVHSSRPDISPVGGAKAVTDSPWARQVLTEGRFFVGSTREDIRAVFSEYELLWSIGCESVLNIPVRKGGVTVGTLNLLDGAGQYDAFSEGPARVFAQFAADRLGAYLASPPAGAFDLSKIERV